STLSTLNSQFLFDRLKDPLRPHEMTGNIRTDFYMIFSLRLKGKHGIEGGYPLDVSGTQLENFSDFHHRLPGYITVHIPGEIKQWDRGGFFLGKLTDNLLNLLRT